MSYAVFGEDVAQLLQSGSTEVGEDVAVSTQHGCCQHSALNTVARFRAGLPTPYSGSLSCIHSTMLTFVTQTYFRRSLAYRVAGQLDCQWGAVLGRT